MTKAKAQVKENTCFLSPLASFFFFKILKFSFYFVTFAGQNILSIYFVLHRNHQVKMLPIYLNNIIILILQVCHLDRLPSLGHGRVSWVIASYLGKYIYIQWPHHSISSHFCDLFLSHKSRNHQSLPSVCL